MHKNLRQTKEQKEMTKVWGKRVTIDKAKNKQAER